MSVYAWHLELQEPWSKSPAIENIINYCYFSDVYILTFCLKFHVFHNSIQVDVLGMELLTGGLFISFSSDHILL